MDDLTKQRHIEILEQSLAQLIAERLAEFSTTTGLAIKSVEVYPADGFPSLTSHRRTQRPIDYMDHILKVKVELEE
jgi:hypothetical protein